MKTFIKLLLLAAVALPAWLTTAAQNGDVAPNGDISDPLDQLTPTVVHQESPAKVPSAIPAQQVTRYKIGENTKNVCSGNSTNSFIPIQCEYIEQPIGSQMIYPSGTLGLTSGVYITSITFHANGNLTKSNNSDSYSTITLKVGETTQSSYSSVSFIDGLTKVCSIGNEFFTGSATITFIFDEPYLYNGGNLVVDLSSDGAGTAYGADVSWYCERQSNAQSISNYYYYGSTSGTSRYLPYITIGYGTRTSYQADAPVSGDANFFHQFAYTWRENGEGTEHTSYLDSIARDPDQIIAMLREVYSNQAIPGNLKRGYKNTGADETFNPDVQYTAAGTIKRSGNNYSFDDTYGWDIPSVKTITPQTQRVSGTNYTYAYMDPTEYTPNQEGLTLLLLEMVDTFNPNTVQIQATGGYAQLREYISKTIKSARVITESKRTGDGFEAGTLFKIDCDKMNKFYLIAKGQLEWKHSVYYEVAFNSNSLDPYNFRNFYSEPCYFYRNGSFDVYSEQMLQKYFFLGHMFEQFSPAIGNADVTKDDIYQELAKNMETFGVDHDCPNVPFVQNGHHFMMYDENSASEDCQDVRDMMFFVPDYRMMAHNKRGVTQTTGATTQEYFKYHPVHQPTMGMFVIRQDSIPEGQIKETYEVTDPEDEDAVTGLYQHQLQWHSNLNKFLPSDDQYYELWEVVINDYGIEEYKPVYYRNENGQYTNKQGAVVSEPVPVILDRSALIGPDDKNNDVLLYGNVYVDMHKGSQTKTYVIQGRDKGENGVPFLSLQMSNRQSIIIPGSDPNEKVRMIGTTHYSRFNAQDTTNCYSNKLQIVDNTLTEGDLTNMYFTRTYRPAQVDANGNVITDAQGNILYVDKNKAVTETIATATYTHTSNTKGQITITVNDATQASRDKFPKTLYPYGGAPDTDQYPSYLNVAGYHANDKLTFDVGLENGKPNFKELYFWDNFTVPVSKNAHPYQYVYKVHMGTAYSNNVPVGVYKTDSKINSFALDSVLSDDQMKLDLPKNVEFEAQVQFGSITELLRVDTYRWDDGNTTNRSIVTQVGVNRYGNDEEVDVAPDGQADNTGNYYTVRMNTGDDEIASDNVPVTQDSPRGWAKFVDQKPQNTGAVKSYDYVPVVETFNFGYRENLEAGKLADRTDYNTYGGPMKTAAIGKLEVEAYQPDDDDVAADSTLAQMSDYKWFNDENRKWYSYYNVYLKFSTLDVPAGYELYKVRAWRQVENGASILGEELSSRAARSEVGNGWYLFEDINYGDPIGQDDKTMRKGTLRPNNPSEYYYLGHRSTSIAKPVNPDGTGGGSVFDYDLTPNQNGNGNQYVEQNVRNEMRATFGAQRMMDPNNSSDPGTLDGLKANFKVRAYFTKSSNPLTTTGTLPQAKAIYVIGNRNMSYEWDPTTSIGALYTEDGLTYTGSVVVNDTNDPKPYDDYSDEGYGYFSFTKRLGSWESINDGSTRLGYTNGGNCWLVEGNGTTHWGEELNCSYATEPAAYRVPAGTYNVKLTLDPEGNNHKVIITKGGAAQAPRRADGAQPMLGSDYDYYIAEGTATMSLEPGSIITGIGAVKMDVNREVVGVTYVNPVGQMSSTPWQGVNIVVTRYSDGSTTTQKVIK